MAKPKGVIKDAYFYYAQLNVPKLQYEKSEVEDDPLANKEYVIDVLVPFKAFQKLTKDFPKDKALKSAKGNGISAEEFKKAYKVDPPEDKAYADSEGEYHVFKLKRFTKDANGGAKAKAFVVGCKTKEPVQRDRTGEEVGIEIAIGNGSFGKVQYEVRSYSKGGVGTALDLLGVQILELVPYVTDEILFDDEDTDWEGDDLDDEIQDEEIEDESEEESQEDDDEWDD